ncbi:MAG: DUF4421 family protein [Cyclobacteriaceae bacterium]|jgi:hypothetical protein|nr:DUF4421 family protein [Cyclobacteriaceae bacterium]
MARALLIIVVLGWPVLVAGESFEQDSLRNDYIESYSHYFFLGPLIKKNDLDFDLVSTGNTKKTYTFKANHSVSAGFNVNLFDVNLGIVFGLPIDVESEELYGKSDVQDLQLIAIGKQWFADVYFQRYNGFYVQYPDLLVPKGQPFPQRSDLITRNSGMSFTYIFNHEEFSLRAPYLFSERQKVSKGSFLVSYVLSSFTMEADSALIPSTSWVDWGAGASVNQLRFTSLGFAPGYSHTFVAKDFFLNLTLALGPAHYWVRYKELVSQARNDIRIDFYSLARIGIGYNGERFFSGLSFTTQSRNVTYEQTTFQNAIGTVRLVAGFRFREEGYMKKKAKDFIPMP